MSVSRLVLALSALLIGLLSGCDSPLTLERLQTRLESGSYEEAQITFYRYAPAELQGYLTSIPRGYFAYEKILEQGPIERLALTYRPRTNQVTISRAGNDLELEYNYVSSTSARGQGPFGEVLALLKAQPTATTALFTHDLYASVDPAEPEYFDAIDEALTAQIRRQSGATSDWRYVEFTLRYALSGDIYTSESALLPLHAGGEASLLIPKLTRVAQDEFDALPNPLPPRTVPGG